MNDTFCFIPARLGSNRLKEKNIKILNKRPLLSYSIEAAKKSNVFGDNIYVSTESKKIKKIANKFGAKVPQLRSELLSSDQSNVCDVLHGFLIQNPFLLNFNSVAIILPTSPFVISDDIQNAIKLFNNCNEKVLMSVCETDHNAYRAAEIINNNLKPIFPDKIPLQTQKLNKTYRINGAVIIIDIKYFMEKKTYFAEKICVFEMPKSRSIDIDNIEDFMYAEFLMKNFNVKI